MVRLAWVSSWHLLVLIDLEDSRHYRACQALSPLVPPSIFPEYLLQILLVRSTNRVNFHSMHGLDRLQAKT